MGLSALGSGHGMDPNDGDTESSTMGGLPQVHFSAVLLNSPLSTTLLLFESHLKSPKALIGPSALKGPSRAL